MDYFAEAPALAETPLLGLLITASDSHILRLGFILKGQPPPRCPAGSPTLLHLQAAEQLIEYLRGRRQTFSLPVLAAGTDFQIRVWAAIASIPYGKTRTYGEIGRMLGDARLARAVGHGANRNPLPLIVPCHRVIGSNGDLTGFACGTATKAYLLGLEQQVIQQQV